MESQESAFKAPEPPPQNQPPRRKHGARTSRACDECRMRKTKCDGGQPCAPCQSFDRFCTYDSTYGRNSGQNQRVRILEHRLRRARGYLQELQSKIPSARHVNFEALLSTPEESRPESSGQESGDNNPEGADDMSKLDSMMGYYGRMTIHDPMTAEFYGASSGLAFLHRTKEYFENPSGAASEFEMSDSTHSAIGKLFDTPLPDKPALVVGVPMSHLLPHRDTALGLLRAVFTQAYPIYQFMHESTFLEKADRLYRLEPMEYDDTDHSFVPLFYIVTGLGFLFRQEEHRKYGCRGAVSHAMRHFVAVRNMVDITQCRSIISLQTLLCSILFLISTARIGLAHTYIGIAVASTFRLGLHFRSNRDSSFSDAERDIRRKIFFTVVRLDIYVNSVLGLPAFVDLQEVDPAIESSIEEALKDAGRQFLPPDEKIRLAASAKHLELLRIIRKGIRTLFPTPPTTAVNRGRRSTISVSIAKLQDIEREFKDWEKGISEVFSKVDGSKIIRSIKYELDMAHYFGHIVLYRPFLHYLARAREEVNTDERQLRCAFACVKVATNVISSSKVALQRGSLYPPSWCSVYTTFLSVVCLVFFIVTHANSPASAEVRLDIEAGIGVLARLTCHDTGAERCLDILQNLIGQFSYAIALDVNEIRTETKSSCQYPAPKQSEDPESKGKGKADDTNNPLSDLSHRPNMPLQSSSTQPDWYTQHFDPYAADLMMNQYLSGSFAEPGAVYPHPSGTDQSPSHTESQLSSADTVEVPFAHEFSWPYGSPSAGSSNRQEGADPNSNPSQFRLSPEDIAAFMRINPIESPFF